MYAEIHVFASPRKLSVVYFSIPRNLYTPKWSLRKPKLLSERGNIHLEEKEKITKMGLYKLLCVEEDEEMVEVYSLGGAGGSTPSHLMFCIFLFGRWAPTPLATAARYMACFSLFHTQFPYFPLYSVLGFSPWDILNVRCRITETKTWRVYPATIVHRNGFSILYRYIVYDISYILL